MELPTELSEAQKILAGGLNLLHMDTENKVMVIGMMLRKEHQVMEMLEWINDLFKKNIMPTQEEVMDKAQEIYQRKE